MSVSGLELELAADDERRAVVVHLDGRRVHVVHFTEMQGRHQLPAGRHVVGGIERDDGDIRVAATAGRVRDRTLEPAEAEAPGAGLIGRTELIVLTRVTTGRAVGLGDALLGEIDILGADTEAAEGDIDTDADGLDLTFGVGTGSGLAVAELADEARLDADIIELALLVDGQADDILEVAVIVGVGRGRAARLGACL
ncbi:MAG: hypothetical protein VW516_08615 [Rhodospirillaceae bacterium]